MNANPKFEIPEPNTRTSLPLTNENVVKLGRIGLDVKSETGELPTMRFMINHLIATANVKKLTSELTAIVREQ